MGSFILYVKQGKKLGDFKLALSENLFQNLGHLGLLEQDFLSSEKGLPEGAWSGKKKVERGERSKKKRQLAIAVESSSGEIHFTNGPSMNPNELNFPFLFIFYLHKIVYTNKCQWPNSKLF